MSVWFRICKAKYKNFAFSGEGSLQVSGRWHPKGTRAVYCSATISLAALEWLSHSGLTAIETPWARLSIEVPDSDIVIPELSELPAGWNVIPDSQISRDFATAVLFRPNKLAMKVPSIVVPEEYNLVINPLHPDAKSLAILDLGDNQFHSRIAGRRG